MHKNIFLCVVLYICENFSAVANQKKIRSLSNLRIYEESFVTGSDWSKENNILDKLII